jgi:tRNA 2-selenouridine synthase
MEVREKRSTVTEGSSRDEAPLTGRNQRARGKDAGSVRSGREPFGRGATEDDASCRSVRARQPRLHLETSNSLQVPSISAAEAMEGGFQVVDVRAPSEFADGHMAGALSLPLLDDEARAKVGVTYKHEGAGRARLVAMELVSAGLPEYLGELVRLARAQPKTRRLALMCWRGGERSRNVALLLALVGVHAVTVEGGYRAYRKEVLSGLAGWRPPMPVYTLYGHTGAGKSAMLRALAEFAPSLGTARPWVVDLEDLALHRGSLLGGLNQPGERTQKDFDSLLWDELRRPRGDYLVLEGEGGRIGRIYVPNNVAEAIRGGLPVLVSAPVSSRAERIMREYAPEGWDETDRERFLRSLHLIAARLPRERVLFLERAFADGRFTDVVEGLLTDYYDPLYQRSCVDGRRFVLELQTTSDAANDARRFAAEVARLT